jgi:hypothetical protein
MVMLLIDTRSKKVPQLPSIWFQKLGFNMMWRLPLPYLIVMFQGDYY